MQHFLFQSTTIENLCLITPFQAPDDRGCLSKTFEKSIFAEQGIDLQPWEELCSYSKKGVLRGLHFQRRHSQDKLVQVLHGAVYDVAVDLREGSKTFGKWFGVVLSEENKKQFFVPKGFAHGYLVLSDYAEFCYKVTDFYHPNDEGGLLWKDPDIGIEWPIPEGMTEADLIFSDKDKIWKGINDYKEDRNSCRKQPQ